MDRVALIKDINCVRLLFLGYRIRTIVRSQTLVRLFWITRIVAMQIGEIRKMFLVLRI